MRPSGLGLASFSPPAPGDVAAGRLPDLRYRCTSHTNATRTILLNIKHYSNAYRDRSHNGTASFTYRRAKWNCFGVSCALVPLEFQPNKEVLQPPARPSEGLMLRSSLRLQSPAAPPARLRRPPKMFPAPGSCVLWRTVHCAPPPECDSPSSRRTRQT